MARAEPTLRSCWTQAAASASASWTRLGSELRCHYLSKHVVRPLHFQTTALGSFDSRWCASLSLAGNLGHLIWGWVRHSSRKSSATHSYQCVQHFPVSSGSGDRGGAGIAQWLEHRTRDWKGSRVQVPAGAAGEVSSPGSTFCADSYFGIRSTPVLPQ